MKTTKKEMALEIENLKSQLKDLKNETKGFNKYGFISDLEDEIKRAIESDEISNEDHMQEYINSAIDNAVIYYRDCFEIAMALNATHFEDDNFGVATDICQHAEYALTEYVQNELNTSDFLELIEAKQNA